MNVCKGREDGAKAEEIMQINFSHPARAAQNE